MKESFSFREIRGIFVSNLSDGVMVIKLEADTQTRASWSVGTQVQRSNLSKSRVTLLWRHRTLLSLLLSWDCLLINLSMFP